VERPPVWETDQRGSSAVDVETSSFEEWDPAGRTFDVGFACKSFHWLDRAIRFPKIASVLVPAGHLAVLST
jgi:trans-aconitate methyltransferase